MKVRMKTLMAGPEGTFAAGQVADLPEAQAQALIEGGYAVAVEAPAQADQAAPVEAPAQAEHAAPVEAAMTTSASTDETMGAGTEVPSSEKPAARRGRSRK
jgi:hypothetical protein